MKEVKIWMGTPKDQLVKAAYNCGVIPAGVSLTLPSDFAGLQYWYVVDNGIIRAIKDIATAHNVKFIY
jgi:hypothetical protein